MVRTFTELETSREGSRPADLYRFDFGAEVFRFCNTEDEVVFGSATYTPLEIKRTSPTINPRETSAQKISIDAPANQRPFSDFSNIQPAKKLEVTITRIQLDEQQTGLGSSPLYPSPERATLPNVGFLVFKGFVTSIAFEGRICSLDVNPDTEQFNREVPRYKYQSLCNHVLYDSQCTLDKNSFSQSGVVNGISGNQITISGFTGSAFTGGYIENSDASDHRMILAHSGDTFTLLLPFRLDVLGTTVKAYQGCAHDVTTCRDKFNNVANYGGFPFVPTKNPFTQNTFIKTSKET